MLTGSCLCGKIRYEITGKIAPVVHCHCSQCRKASGSAFATNAAVRTKYFRWLAGEERLVRYESSPGKFRCFCRDCGSPIAAYRTAIPDEIRIRLGTLDGDPERRPAAHIWAGSKAPWFEITDDLPRYEEGVVPPKT